MKRVCIIFLCLTQLAFGHAVDQIYGRLKIAKGQWTLDWVVDIGYAEGSWDDPDEPQKLRAYLLGLSDLKHKILRQKIAKIMKESVTIPGTGYVISFPDYARRPFDFPLRMDEGAYVTARMQGKLPQGAFYVGIREGDRPSFVVQQGEGDKEQYLTIWPGDKELVLNKTDLRMLGKR